MRSLWGRSLPIAVAIIGAVLSGLVWWQAGKSRDEVVRLGFQREASRVEAAIRERVDLYETVLRAAQGFLESSIEVSPLEWARFAATMRLEERFPGIQGLLYLEYVPNAERLGVLMRLQRLRWGEDFTLRRPPGYVGGDDHYVAVLVAPMDRADIVLGLDFGGEPVRRALAEAARDTGEVRLSPVMPLIKNKSAAMAIGVAPVYVSPHEVETVVDRRVAFKGLVVASYDLIRILDRATGLAAPDLRVTIHDRPTGTDGRTAQDLIGQGDLVYERGPVIEITPYRHEAHVTFGERLWTVTVEGGAGVAERLAARDTQPFILLVGFAASLALAVLAHALITRRRQAQELAERMTAALQESEERYRQLFVGNRAVELLIEPDTGRIVDANAAAARFYGWSVDDLRAMRISDINTLTPQEVRTEMMMAAAERRSHFLFRHRLANGDIRDVEVHSGPVPQGRDQLLYSIIHDVTERRQAEKALAVSEARFRALFEDSPLGIQVLAPDGETVRTNGAARRLWGGTIEGSPLDDPLLRRAGVCDLLSKALAGEPTEIPPFRYRLPAGGDDDGVRWVRGYAYPIRDPDSQGHQLIVVWENVTEKVKQEERLSETLTELERSNADLEQFAYVASHDLQEPLRMISSYIGLLQRRHGEEMAPEALEFMAYAVDGAHRMQDIINDLLTYSRVGRKGRPFAPVALGKVVSLAVGTLALAIEEAGARVEVAEPLPTILGDDQELARLFQNLIGNAVKYRRDGVTPTIRVRWSKVDDLCRVEIADNGIGVGSEFHDRIFQIFQRLHTRDQYGGTGVGLAVCKKIVERHGGHIGVESTVGDGATFWFTLPFPPDDGRATEVSDGRRAPVSL